MVFFMSVQLTGESLNQWLSMGSLAAVIAGVPRRVLLSMLSFFCGLLFYKPTASILIGIASLIPTITQDSFEKGVVFSSGAFVSAIVAVRIGIWLYHRSDNPRELIPGRKDDGNA